MTDKLTDGQTDKVSSSLLELLVAAKKFLGSKKFLGPKTFLVGARLTEKQVCCLFVCLSVCLFVCNLIFSCDKQLKK